MPLDSTITKLDWSVWLRKVSCGPGRGRRARRESARCHCKPQRESSDHAAHVGMGPLARIAKHGRRIEIIKSAEWNDRMNRNPRRALSDFDCRVLSGPLAGPWTRGGHDISISINLSTSSVSAVSCQRISSPPRALLFQGYHRSFSDPRGRHHDLSIPTPNNNNNSNSGNWRHVPPTRTEQQSTVYAARDSTDPA